MENRARKSENRFFTRNNVADLSRLFITCLPSATIPGILEKSESKSTTWAAWEAASAPWAMAIEQSAVFIARMSFTPSPVMATVLPSFFKERINFCFCSGEVLPNMVHSTAALASSSSDLTVVMSTYLSAFSIPACLATSDTVSAWSPDITFTSTPCFLKYLSTFGAFSLIGFIRRMKKMGTASSDALRGCPAVTSLPSLRLAKTITLIPRAA